MKGNARCPMCRGEGRYWSGQIGGGDWQECTQPGFAEGCCSAIYPCTHQQKSPYTICDTCLRAKVYAAMQRASDNGYDMRTFGTAEAIAEDLCDGDADFGGYADANTPEHARVVEACAAWLKETPA